MHYKQEKFVAKYRGEFDVRGGEVRVFASNGPNYFSLHTLKGEKIRFRALNNEERDAWTRVLGSVIFLTSGAQWQTNRILIKSSNAIQ